MSEPRRVGLTLRALDFQPYDYAHRVKEAHVALVAVDYGQTKVDLRDFLCGEHRRDVSTASNLRLDMLTVNLALREGQMVVGWRIAARDFGVIIELHVAEQVDDRAHVS